MTIREFEAYFRRLYLPLGMYALRIVDDADVAEDMVQDAFLILGKDWRVDWKYQISRHSCIEACATNVFHIFRH